MIDQNNPDTSDQNWWQYALVGALAGFLSGLFGIGGGTVIVPALVIWLRMNHRISAGTSLAAILPMAISGAISYAIRGDVDWTAALLLAVGIIVGAQVGSLLLAKLKLSITQWGFLIFLLVIIVSLWFIVPERGDTISLSFLVASLIALTGFITGILSGLLGVGGGVIVVPVLMFFFGTSDLVAKGTSLVMMIPGAVSGTIASFKRGNVNMRAAALVGFTGVVAAPLGSIAANKVDPFWGNVAFSAYLTVIFIQLLIKQLKKSSS